MIDKAAAGFSLKGIIFSVQMHGFILHSGNEALTPYISWQDMRAFGRDGREDIASHITERAGGDLLRRNGVILKNSHSLCPLYRLINEKRLTGKLRFSMMGDALIHLLTGTVVPIHPTVAASSALYDLEKMDWNRELLEKLSLENIEFPPVRDGREPIAAYKISSSEIPVYSAVGDHQAAVLGCGAADSDLVINIGTGGQISFVDENLNFGDYETRPFFSGRYLRTLAQLPSGRNLNVLMNLVLDAGNQVCGAGAKPDTRLWDRINNLAQEAADEKDIPSLKLTMSFFDPPGGAITGVDTQNLKIGNIFLAAYADMADSYFAARKRLGLNGRQQGRLIGAGGVLHKTPILQKMLTDRFGLPLEPLPHSEDVMSGLLKLVDCLN
jgi:xylulokinase